MKNIKNYKNIKELNKEWEPYGFRVDEDGKIFGTVDGKEYKVGQLRLADEEEINEIEKKKGKWNRVRS